MGQTETICDLENEAEIFNESDEKLAQNNQEYVKNKMEVMQRRIDELKEKVKNEGELLHNEASFKSDTLVEKFQDSQSIPNELEQQVSENESGSDKLLYYSASNYSLCSSSGSSADTAYNNFTKFVNNFVKNQNPKERLSLLQLHSKKQISLNMMRHSLSEIETRCTEELELITRSLQHLHRLASEFKVNIPSDDENEDGKLKVLEFHSSDALENKKLKVRSNPVFIWPHEERKSRMNGHCNPTFLDISKKDKSSVRE